MGKKSGKSFKNFLMVVSALLFIFVGYWTLLSSNPNHKIMFMKPLTQYELDLWLCRLILMATIFTSMCLGLAVKDPYYQVGKGFMIAAMVFSLLFFMASFSSGGVVGY